MAATGLHISLSAEPVLQLGGLTLTNSMITSVIVSALLIIFAVIVNRSLKNTSKPTGIQNVAEWIIESLYGLVQSITGDLKRTSLFFPFIATFFLFILLNNWFGLLPGVGSITVTPRLNDSHSVAEVSKEAHTEEKPAVAPSTSAEKTKEVATTDTHDTTEKSEHAEESATEVVAAEEFTANSAEHAEPALEEEHAPATEHEQVHLLRAGTADLNMTIALGIITIVMVQFFGVKFLHLSYFGKFFNFSSPIMFFVGILELISEVGKILSFAFRLFGNVFAGEVLLAVISYLAGAAVPIPFYGLEVFVGFIQALVFSMLSLVFMNMATIGHGEEH